MRNERTLGSVTERRAEEYLVGLGFRILERNYRKKTGEIDLIGRQGNTLCFVEVKYRKSLEFGLPEESVDRRKCARIRRTAEWYLATHGQDPRVEYRFDVVALDDREIRYYENAF